MCVYLMNEARKGAAVCIYLDGGRKIVLNNVDNNDYYYYSYKFLFIRIQGKVEIIARFSFERTYVCIYIHREDTRMHTTRSKNGHWLGWHVAC